MFNVNVLFKCVCVVLKSSLRCTAVIIPTPLFDCLSLRLSERSSALLPISWGQEMIFCSSTSTQPEVKTHTHTHTHRGGARGGLRGLKPRMFSEKPRMFLWPCPVRIIITEFSCALKWWTAVYSRQEPPKEARTSDWHIHLIINFI